MNWNSNAIHHELVQNAFVTYAVINCDSLAQEEKYIPHPTEYGRWAARMIQSRHLFPCSTNCAKLHHSRLLITGILHRQNFVERAKHATDLFNSSRERNNKEALKNGTFNQPNIVILSQGWIASHNVCRTVTIDLVTTFFPWSHVLIELQKKNV